MNPSSLFDQLFAPPHLIGKIKWFKRNLLHSHMKQWAASENQLLTESGKLGGVRSPLYTSDTRPVHQHVKSIHRANGNSGYLGGNDIFGLMVLVKY